MDSEISGCLQKGWYVCACVFPEQEGIMAVNSFLLAPLPNWNLPVPLIPLLPLAYNFSFNERLMVWAKHKYKGCLERNYGHGYTKDTMSNRIYSSIGKSLKSVR